MRRCVLVLGLGWLLACTDAQPPARVGPSTVEPSPVSTVPSTLAQPKIIGGPEPREPGRAASLELTFVGDVVLGRYLEHLGDEVFVEMHPAHADPFAAVAGLLAADVVVGNLESPIVRELPQRSPIAHRNQFAGSAAHLGQLERAGFDVLSLANNHFFDLGVTGQLDGPQALADVGLLAIGASRREPPLLRIETLEVEVGALGSWRSRRFATTGASARVRIYRSRRSLRSTSSTPSSRSRSRGPITIC